MEEEDGYGAHDSVFDLCQNRDPIKQPKIPKEFKEYVKKEEVKKRGEAFIR